MNNKLKSLLCVAYLIFFYYLSLAYRQLILTFAGSPQWVMTDARVFIYVLGYLMVYVPLAAYAIYYLVNHLTHPTP